MVHTMRPSLARARGCTVVPLPPQGDGESDSDKEMQEDGYNLLTQLQHLLKIQLKREETLD
jgi:hypothetical protein